MFQLKEEDLRKAEHYYKRGDSLSESRRAHALLLRQGGFSPAEVAAILLFTPRTVINITDRYEESGLERALKDNPRPGQPTRIDDRVKAKIVAIACSDPPEGFDRWTLEFIQEELLEMKAIDSISKESIRLVLKEHDIKPWRKKMWCIPSLNSEYINHMESVLDEYEKPYDPKNPLICLDEKPVVLFEDKRAPIMMDPGEVKKVDYEYKRNGSVNLFMAVEPKKGRYIVEVTENRGAEQFSHFLKMISENYEEANKITLILDNLSTHSKNSLIKTFGNDEATRIWSRFNVKYTPKHGSWLNQAEIAIGMYSRQSLGKTRIPDIKTLRKKSMAWSRYINDKSVTINWTFTSRDAQLKFNYLKN